MLINGESLDSIPGWFWPVDVQLFQWFLEDQNSRRISGDLVELGTYYGKSAVLIGSHVQPGEKFTVIDLYETPAGDEANRGENADQYGGLTRAAFEANYLRFHAVLPNVVQGVSSEIRDHVEPGSVRFSHIDASHHYEHVRDDAEAARTYLMPDGVVVFDDYRSPHTPGTAAAVWEAVLMGGLKPVALSETKFYGTWGQTTAVQERLRLMLDGQSAWRYELHDIAGEPAVRLFAASERRSLARRVAGKAKRALLGRR